MAQLTDKLMVRLGYTVLSIEDLDGDLSAAAEMVALEQDPVAPHTGAEPLPHLMYGLP